MKAKTEMVQIRANELAKSAVTLWDLDYASRGKMGAVGKEPCSGTCCVSEQVKRCGKILPLGSISPATI